MYQALGLVTRHVRQHTMIEIRVKDFSSSIKPTACLASSSRLNFEKLIAWSSSVTGSARQFVSAFQPSSGVCSPRLCPWPSFGNVCAPTGVHLSFFVSSQRLSNLHHIRFRKSQPSADDEESHSNRRAIFHRRTVVLRIRAVEYTPTLRKDVACHSKAMFEAVITKEKG